MFQCIACTKQAAEEDRDEQVHQTVTETGTEGSAPANNQAVKSLTAQLKDMALKFTGGHKQPRSSGAGSSNYRRGPRPYNFDTNSEGVQEGIGGDQAPRRNEQVAAYNGVLEDDDNDIMWIAQIEPGVHITFVPLPNGGNDLRRIRFNRDMFDRWQAQAWWGENYDRIIELYNVQRFNRRAITPPNSEDEQGDAPSLSRQPSGRDSPVAAWLNPDSTPTNQYYQPSGITVNQGNNSQQIHAAGARSSILSMTSSQDEPFFVNASLEGEWIEQDVAGVFLTIKQLPDGSKELLRVRFSRQRFGEDDAKKWWEENRERIRAQYLE